MDDRNDIDAHRGDVAYWRTRPIEERFAELQRLRIEKWGDAADGHVEKVIECVDFEVLKDAE